MPEGHTLRRLADDLLGRDLVWVTGVIAALVGLTQILGNALEGIPSPSSENATSTSPGASPREH